MKEKKEKPSIVHLENKDFSRGPIDVKLGEIRLISIDTLSREKVHNIVFSVFVAVTRRYL